MSRIAKVPILIPAGVEIKLEGQVISVKGKNDELIRTIHNAVIVNQEANVLNFVTCAGFANALAQAGTARSLISSMVIGVTKGFTKKLQLVGVGYRVTVKGNVVSLALGYSHSIEYQLPVGIAAECLSQTEILLRGADKQVIGQAAADLRAYRRPEPYKGKGIRYANEIVRIKEAKKK